MGRTLARAFCLPGPRPPGEGVLKSRVQSPCRWGRGWHGPGPAWEAALPPRCGCPVGRDVPVSSFSRWLGKNPRPREGAGCGGRGSFCLPQGQGWPCSPAASDLRLETRPGDKRGGQAHSSGLRWPRVSVALGGSPRGPLGEDCTGRVPPPAPSEPGPLPQMTYSLTRFAIYETVRDHVAKDSQGPLPFYKKVLLGSISGELPAGRGSGGAGGHHQSSHVGSGLSAQVALEASWGRPQIW